MSATGDECHHSLSETGCQLGQGERERKRERKKERAGEGERGVAVLSWCTVVATNLQVYIISLFKSSETLLQHVNLSWCTCCIYMYTVRNDFLSFAGQHVNFDQSICTLEVVTKTQKGMK